MKIILVLLLSLTANANEPQRQYSEQDLKDSVCWIVARQNGYENGSYDAKTKKCLYFDSEDFKDATKEVITLPRSFRGGMPNSQSRPQHFYFDKE